VGAGQHAVAARGQTSGGSGPLRSGAIWCRCHCHFARGGPQARPISASMAPELGSMARVQGWPIRR
jgi:hypothetical protein